MHSRELLNACGIDRRGATETVERRCDLCFVVGVADGVLIVPHSNSLSSPGGARDVTSVYDSTRNVATTAETTAPRRDAPHRTTCLQTTLTQNKDKLADYDITYSTTRFGRRSELIINDFYLNDNKEKRIEKKRE